MQDEQIARNPSCLKPMPTPVWAIIYTLHCLDGGGQIPAMMGYKAQTLACRLLGPDLASIGPYRNQTLPVHLKYIQYDSTHLFLKTYLDQCHLFNHTTGLSLYPFSHQPLFPFYMLTNLINLFVSYLPVYPFYPSSKFTGLLVLFNRLPVLSVHPLYVFYKFTKFPI